MRFEILSPITNVATIASGTRVRIRKALRKLYGPGRWRKLKGIATIRLANGGVRRVELHWYEAHGIGRKDFKIKRYVDEP